MSAGRLAPIRLWHAGEVVKLCGSGSSGQEHERKYSPSEWLGARKETIIGDPDPKRVSTSCTDHN